MRGIKNIMASHERLYCGNCKTEFEIAWKNMGDIDIEDVHGSLMTDAPVYCPFCGSPDIDDPLYFSEDDL